MPGGRGGDDESVDPDREHRLRVSGELQSLVGSHPLRLLGIGVRDDDLVDGVQSLEGLGMEGADPPHPNQPNAHVRRPFIPLTRRRR